MNLKKLKTYKKTISIVVFVIFLLMYVLEKNSGLDWNWLQLFEIGLVVAFDAEPSMVRR